MQTNAQFTYDVQPGHGILEEKSSSISPASTMTTLSSPSSITYESLANYLDYELPQQQQQQQQIQQHQHIQQLQALQAIASTARAPHQQLLLPKIVPEMTLEEITKALLSTANTNTAKPPVVEHKLSNTPAQQSKNTATPMDISSPTDHDKVPAEEDKRKRNTAASARFRIKKKMREQTMEKTVREMTEKSNGLEDRVKELELEIKWLRGLLIEKGTSAPVTKPKDEPSS